MLECFTVGSRFEGSNRENEERNLRGKRVCHVFCTSCFEFATFFQPLRQGVDYRVEK